MGKGLQKMTQPNKADVAAVPGIAVGATSASEMQSDVNFDIVTDSVGDAGANISKANDWHASSVADTTKQPKYGTPGYSYLAGGAISVDPDKGKVVIARRGNETTKPAFSVDESESTMYSSADKTTLGSLKISTVDGYELNPTSAVIPSTPFSPTKPWWKQLFPDFTSKEFITIALLEGIQLLLLEAIEDTSGGSAINTSEEIDLGRIILDNQELEDKWFSG